MGQSGVNTDRIADVRGVPLISPVLAFLYKPLGSRSSTTSNGASIKTSTNPNDAFSCNSRTSVRSEIYGEMKAVIAIAQASANSFATYVESDPSQRFRRGCPGIEEDRPRRSFEYFRFSTFRRTQGPCLIRTECCRHQAYRKTCPGATSVVPTHKRSSTKFFMGHLRPPRGVGLPLTFPLALRPVNQIVTPFCLSRSTRSDGSTEPGWKVMLVAIGEG